MEHRQLLNFLAVCEEKNFTRAAGRRFITQQGLSLSIRELEKELDLPLFERGHRGAALTEYGRALESAARAWTNQHEHILETLQSMKEKRDLRLSIGISHGNLLLQDFLTGFIMQHPEIDLSVKTFSADVCQRQLLEQRIQIGFSFPPIDANLFDSFLFQKIRLRLIIGKTHPLAKRKSIKLEELKNENVIHFTTNLYPNSYVLELCRRSGVKIETQLDSFDYGLVASLCATGRYIGFGGKGVRILKDLAMIDIEDSNIYVEHYLVVNKLAFINEAAKTFIAYAKENVFMEE
jgi:DNA-binding transcriptional LysR family regulator